MGLLELKATAGKAFKRAAYDRFTVDAHGAVAYRSMAVAAMYSSRPEITARLCWDALAALSSPSLPAHLREALEARILAGERIGSPEIRRARQAHVGTTGCRIAGINPSPARPREKMAA